MTIKMKSFSYAPVIPEGYACSHCGLSGVQLWREYNTFMDQQVLYCVDCACKAQKKPRFDSWQKTYEVVKLADALECIHTNKVLAEKTEWPVEKDEYNSFPQGDQIGWLIPAVPTEEGDSFWGYTSVPQDGVNWWQSLPLRKSEQ